MRVFISADMEGCCGVVSWGQCGRPSGDHYDYAFARRMMTEDVNAAVRGALAAGATEVLVKDSHGNSKNLLLDQLEPGAALVSGIGPEAHGMMAGLRPEFDAAVLVGYHAMAGTRAGVLAHTYTGTVHRLAVNGQPAGEIYLSYATAGWMGVPVVAVVSDDKGCAEASALDPATHTVATKHGRGRFAAALRPAGEARAEIERTVEAAVRGRAKATPFRPAPPYAVEVEFNELQEADAVEHVPGWERADGYTLRTERATWDEAHLALLQALMRSAAGHRFDT